jgi:predicted TIM-barrel fold metal-dependent hydrolase
MEQMAAMASLVFGGALERHADMTVAFLESGTGWLPWWLHRLDEHEKWMHDAECAQLSLTPAEYFGRQCVISADPDDHLAVWAINHVGADHIMWASDFPHPDAVFPGAVDAFRAEATEHGAAAADLDMLFWETPVRVYNLTERLRDRVK